MADGEGKKKKKRSVATRDHTGGSGRARVGGSDQGYEIGESRRWRPPFATEQIATRTKAKVKDKTKTEKFNIKK